MKKLKFTESQIVNILKLAELAQKVNGICREQLISSVTLYHWRSQHGDMTLENLAVKDLLGKL